MTTPFTFHVAEARVVDGDTIECLLDLGMAIFSRQSVRVFGVDAPETHGAAACPEGIVATFWLSDWIAKTSLSHLRIESKGWDKYGGRVDAIVTDVDDAGHVARVLASDMVVAGMAQPYFGGAKLPWTPEKLAALRATPFAQALVAAGRVAFPAAKT